MIGKTLGLYISFRFLKVLAAMVLGLGFMIVTVDFIEQLRKAADYDDVSITSLYMISLLRAPTLVERAFPFACLFAAMITLTQLNTRMELVIARSAGVSAWQFLLPISFSAAIVGVAVAMLYNPVAIIAYEESNNRAAELVLGNKPKQEESRQGYWIKQEEEDGSRTIINAELARQSGKLLDNVTVIRFLPDGHIKERIDASKAIFRNTHWTLIALKITDASGNSRTQNSMKLKTGLTESELLGITAKPEGVSFWKLLEVAERVEKSGTNGKPYVVQYHSLTALPMFLVAMVLVAATVCLRFVRFGQVGRMILGGIFCGFVLYTVTSLTTALGSNGVVPPLVAAWSPGFVAILFGMSVLLHQEDG